MPRSEAKTSLLPGSALSSRPCVSVRSGAPQCDPQSNQFLPGCAGCSFGGATDTDASRARGSQFRNQCRGMWVAMTSCLKKKPYGLYHDLEGAQIMSAKDMTRRQLRGDPALAEPRLALRRSAWHRCRTRKHRPVRIRGAMESVWPGLAIQAHSRPFPACIAEPRVQSQGPGPRIEAHHEQAMLSVFARVHDDAPALFICGDPVGLLLVVERDSRHLADVAQIENIVGRDRVYRGQRLNPVVSECAAARRTVLPQTFSRAEPKDVSTPSIAYNPHANVSNTSVRNSFRSDSRHTCTVRLSPSFSCSGSRNQRRCCMGNDCCRRGGLCQPNASACQS